MLLPLLLVGNTAMHALCAGMAGVLLALQVEPIDRRTRSPTSA
ncbi:hypothetical protein [Streptomyces sp. NBC_01408]|nr:hypothetical protein [Streptomyces sp. NBC_01408]MCX4695561.1 hypothetical protein [Streptomyces sp. NBC_01408]